MKAKNKNKNKKFLFLIRERNMKDVQELFKTFIAASLIVSITSGCLSYLDERIIERSKNVYKQEDNINSLEQSTENIFKNVLAINEVSAATVKYKAVNLSKNASISINAEKGKNFTFTVQYKNDGINFWRREGTHIMTLNVKDNKTSIFNNSKIVGKLSEKDVAEGQTGTFKVTLKAPAKEGVFTEKYQMYIKSFGQFVAGSEIEIKVDTTGKSGVLGQSTSDDKEIKVEDITYIKCDKDFQILDTKTNQILVKVPANEIVNLFFNQSTKEYIISKNGLIIASLKNKVSINNLNNGTLDFGNKKTDNSKLIAFKSDFDIKVAEVSTVICASSGCGSVPIVDNTVANSNNTVANSNYAIQNYTLASIPLEYKVRVGIVSEIFPARFTSTHGFKIVDSLGNLIVDVYQGNEITIDYNKTTRMYIVSQSGIVIKETNNYIKLQNNDVVSGVITIVNYERRPDWNTSINFNMYRGDLEIRHNDTYDKTWVINELLVEDYLKGMGEASDSSSYEYLKTMAVAERTYAAFHYLSNKNSKSYFHMFSTESDQVYDGYVREIRQPNVVSAVNETRGVVALYNNELIQAFYSANAGGVTKTISQAWGGTDLPYLKAVEDKYTKSDALFGHGIGLSQVGAMRMIYNESATYDKVLRYYYSGIELKKIY